MTDCRKRDPALRSVLALLGGLTLGSAAAAGDLTLRWDASGVATVLFVLSNLGSLWVLAAFVAGVLSRRHGHAALAGALVLVAAVAGYFCFAFTAGTRVEATLSDLADAAPVIAVWLVIALVAGSSVGLLAFLYRFGREMSSLLGAVVVPAALVGETVFRLATSRPSPGDDPWWYGTLLAWGIAGVLLMVFLLTQRADRLKKMGGAPAGAPPQQTPTRSDHS